MKKLLGILFVLSMFVASQAQAQTTIWGSSDRSATTTEMRFPVSTSAVDTPGLLRIEPANQNGIYMNSAGRLFATGLLFDSAGSLFLSGAAQYCDENGANCFAPSTIGGALQNIVEDLSPQLGANLDLNGFVVTGLVIGTDIQAFDDILDDLSVLAVVADNEFIVGTGVGAYAHESGATARTSMGVAIGSDVEAFDTNLEDIAALAVVADNELMVGTGVGTYAFESGATLQTSLGLAIGTNVQAWDAVLDDLSALAVIADNEFIVGTGAGTYANEAGATARASMGVAIGTDVQAFDAVLEDLAALAVIADNEIIVGTGAGTYANEGGATARTSLGLAIGTDIQAFDAVLEDLASLSVIADNEFIVGTGAGTYANESGATVRTSLGLTIGTDVQAFDTNLEDIAALTVVADNEVMIGTGAGLYAFESGATLLTSIGAIGSVVEDTTPQLGGDLDGLNNIFENVGAIRYQSSRDQPACTTALEGTIFYNSSTNRFNFCDDVGSVQIFSTGGAGLANIVEDTSPQLGAQLDINAFGLGDGTLELLTFTEDGSAINHINIENEAIGSGPILSAAGDDTNVDLNLNGQLTGNVVIRDGTDVTKAFSMELGGATTGTTTTLAVSQTGNVTVTLPDATDTLVGKATTDALTNKSMAAGSNTFTGFVWGTNIFANGTDGEVLTFSSTGEPDFVPVGTAAQVLTSNGAGLPPTFQAAGGGGAWVLIGTAVASSSATLTITGLSSTYDQYAIAWSDMIPENDTAPLWLRFGDSGGVDAGASDYSYHISATSHSSASYAASVGQTEAEILVADNTGNDTGEGAGGLVFLHSPADATGYARMSGTVTWLNGAVFGRGGSVSAYRTAVITLDRVQLIFATGDLASGRLSVWGISHD